MLEQSIPTPLAELQTQFGVAQLNTMSVQEIEELAVNAATIIDHARKKLGIKKNDQDEELADEEVERLDQRIEFWETQWESKVHEFTQNTGVWINLVILRALLEDTIKRTIEKSTKS